MWDITLPYTQNYIKRGQSHSFQSQNYFCKYNLNSVLHVYVLKLILQSQKATPSPTWTLVSIPEK